MVYPPPRDKLRMVYDGVLGGIVNLNLNMTPSGVQVTWVTRYLNSDQWQVAYFDEVVVITGRDTPPLTRLWPYDEPEIICVLVDALAQKFPAVTEDHIIRGEN